MVVSGKGKQVATEVKSTAVINDQQTSVVMFGVCKTL